MAIQRTEEAVAYCQASRAVVAHLLGFKIISASVDATTERRGRVRLIEPYLPSAPFALTGIRDRIAIEDIITMRLAGQAGETRYSFGWSGPWYNLSPDDDDVADALVLAERIAPGHSDAVIAGTWERLTELIDGGAVWPAIEAIAAVLLDEAELTGEEVAEVIAGA